MKTMTYAVLFVLALVFSAPPARAAQAQASRSDADLRGRQADPGSAEVLRVSRHRDDDHRHHRRHRDRHRDRHHRRHHDRHHRHHKHKDNDGKKAAAIAAGVALAAVVAAAAVSAKNHRDHDDDDRDVRRNVIRICNREARDWIESRRHGEYARVDRIQKVRYHDHRWRLNIYYRLVFDNRTRTRLARCVVDDRRRVRRFEFD